jgi:hypothetical protein
VLHIWSEPSYRVGLVCVKYKTLLNADVKISDNDYHTLIINFLPSHLASFVAQISANMKAIAMVHHASAAATSTTLLPPYQSKALGDVG